jgi:pSer/pThr/pTyr-binding forkhead associated (FHA) protein
MDVMMLCYSDSHGQHRIALDRETTSIGLSPDQDIVMRDSGISRSHAIILREGSSYLSTSKAPTAPS